MAIDFNGVDSKLEHLTAALGIGTDFTICVWTFADSTGEGGNGTILAVNETADLIKFDHTATAGTLSLRATFSGTSGNWTFPAADGVWNAIAVSFSGASVSNNPTARVNFANVTVTETVTPVGTFFTSADGYCIGNRVGGAATWDGAIAYLQVFSRVLSSEEMDRALRLPGSVRPGLVLFPFMLDTAHTFDLSGNGFHPTLVFLANREGPPARTVWMASDDDETSLLSVVEAAGITEAGDTLAAAAGVAVQAAGLIQESADTLSATAQVAIAAAAAIQEAADTASGGAGGLAGAASITEGAESLLASGHVAVVGAAEIQESLEQVAATGVLDGCSAGCHPGSS